MMKDETVLAKAEAAATWCWDATEHGEKTAGKPWRYLLIPEDRITASATLEGLAASCAYREMAE